MNNLNDFLASIFVIFPELEHQYVELVKDWKPEEPPLNIVMGELARGIDPSKISCLQEVQLFNLLEEGLNSKDKRFSDAVATGLLECLLDTYILKGRGNDSFWGMLGEESKMFLEAIIDFYQMEIYQNGK